MKKPVKFTAVIPLHAPVRTRVLKRDWLKLDAAQQGFDSYISYNEYRKKSVWKYLYYKVTTQPNPAIGKLRALLKKQRVAFTEAFDGKAITFKTL